MRRFRGAPPRYPRGVPVDHFPTTHATWIDAQLTIAERSRAAGDEAGETNAVAALRTYLMERYYDALRVYVRTGALVHLGEPEEIVGEFFARAVDTRALLVRWRESGMPLRRWMMNAIAFHCRGTERDRSRERRRTMGDADLDAFRAPSPDAARAFDRAWAVALAGEAFAIAEREAEARDRPQDAVAFRMHALDGMTHRAIARELGISESQSANAAKRVSERMRAAVRDLLRDEGVPAGEIDAAVAEVLALVDEAAGGGDRAPRGES